MKATATLLVLSTVVLVGCKISLFRHRFIQDDRAQAIPGIYPKSDTASVSVVVFVHGMGRKDQNYSYFSINQMAKKSLGKHYRIVKDPAFYNSVDSLSPQLEKFIATGDQPNRKMVFYSLRYSNFSDTIKDSMKTNESILDRKYRRGFLTRAAKEGFIDQFKDVMTVQETNSLKKIIHYFDLTIHDATTKYFPNSGVTKINFITSSLGSAVTAAYLYDFYLNKASEKCNAKIQTNFEHELFSKNLDSKNTKYAFHVYQLTNQLILFDTSIRNWGNDKNAEPASLTDANKKTLSSSFSLNVYSFRNPKDLLCFYVPPQFYQALFKDDINVNKVINIHYKNVFGHNDFISSHIHPLNSKRIAKKLVTGIPAKTK